ncbi:MAG: 3-dehydroquinate synthase [Candidatus Gygaella obscura]|nr:3-dehydroquinate synthase [Candidatus Gygaella obscura]
MKSISNKVRLKNRSYSIIIGSNILTGLSKQITKLKIGNDAIIITNTYLKNKYANKLTKGLRKNGFSVKEFIVPDSEKAKSFTQINKILTAISAYDKDKRLFIIALGGGVVGDLSGFIASVYKRGVPYIQVPTTLLAQIDSSIGGKTAINLAVGKNLIGAFYQPKLVICDVNLLMSLKKRDLLSGLGETIKYAVIKDRKFFKYLEDNIKKILSFKTDALIKIVNRCSKIKSDIISADEKEEKSIRTILNFGHTIGHAIEAASSYDKYRHGEAITLGMLCAIELSHRLGILNKKDSERIETLIKKVGLPTKIKGLSLEKIINAYYHDKKFIGKTNRFVLTSGIGKTVIKKNIPLALVKEVIKKRLF